MASLSGLFLTKKSSVVEKKYIKTKSYSAWTKEEEEIIINNFSKIKTWKELIPLLPNKNYNGIKSKGTELKLRTSPVFTWNKEFFKIPNNINCFVAGVLASDGCLIDKRRRGTKIIALKLAQKDIEFLEKIKKVLDFTGNITKGSIIKKLKLSNDPIPKEYFHCELKLSGADGAFENLYNNWRVTPRKSLTLQAPDIQKEEHVLSYFLGYFYGDGWFNKRKRKNQATLEILGTKELLEYFNGFLNSFFNTNNGSILKTKSQAYAVKIAQGKTYLLIKCFEVLGLQDCMLQRKWDKMQEFKREIEESELNHVLKAYLKQSIVPQVRNFIERNGGSLPEKFLNNSSHPT